MHHQEMASSRRKEENEASPINWFSRVEEVLSNGHDEVNFGRL
jgi:hypothetical protein